MPDTKWDRFDAAASRLDDDMDFREVLVKNWQRQYDESTGDYDYELGDGTLVQAELRQPNMPRTVTGPEGGDTEVDVECYIREDENANLVAAGSEDRATVIEDTTDGRQFTVTEFFAEDNGLIRASAVER